MVQKLIVSLFTTVLILTSLGNGIHSLGQNPEGSETSVEVCQELEGKFSSYSYPNLGLVSCDKKNGTSYQISKLLIYFHNISHYGLKTSKPDPLLTLIEDTGPPNHLS